MEYEIGARVTLRTGVTIAMGALTRDVLYAARLLKQWVFEFWFGENSQMRMDGFRTPDSEWKGCSASSNMK